MQSLILSYLYSYKQKYKQCLVWLLVAYYESKDLLIQNLITRNIEMISTSMSGGSHTLPNTNIQLLYSNNAKQYLINNDINACCNEMFKWAKVISPEDSNGFKVFLYDLGIVNQVLERKYLSYLLTRE